MRGPLDDLATGEFIGRRGNIIFVGKSGLGKSHLIQGIGRSCCASGHRVPYVTSAELLEDLTSAAGGKSLSTRVRRCLFSEWTQYLGDPLLVMALLDRVVDSAITIRFDGKSYRQHRAEQMRSSASNRAKPST